METDYVSSHGAIKINVNLAFFEQKNANYVHFTKMFLILFKEI